MSDERLRQLLAELRNETRNTEVGADVKATLVELDSDIHRILDSSVAETDAEGVLERAKLLETEFAASHPALERFMREVIDTLVKIGL